MHVSLPSPVHRLPSVSNDERRSRPTRGVAKTCPGALRNVAVLISVVLALGACTANDTPSGAAQPSPSPPTASQDKEGNTVRPQPKKVTMSDKTKSENTGRTGENPATAHSMSPELMAKLVDSVAREAGVSTDKVILERAEDTTWNDGSMGCPQPNMAYTQALVEGHWAVFHVGNEEFDLRVTRRGTFMRCKGSTKQAPIRYEDS